MNEMQLCHAIMGQEDSKAASGYLYCLYDQMLLLIRLRNQLMLRGNAIVLL